MKQVQVTVTAADDLPRDLVIRKLAKLYKFERVEERGRQGYRGFVIAKPGKPVDFTEVINLLNSVGSLTKDFSIPKMSKSGRAVTSGSAEDTAYAVEIGINYIDVYISGDDYSW